MYRVVLVDDERLILEGLSKVVNWQSMGCMVAGTAADGMEGLRLIRELLPHIVLTDIRMPNMDGLTMLAALRSEFPQMQVTVLTAYRDFDYAQKAINLGVCRYLLKPSRMEEINEAIRTMVKRLEAAEPSLQNEAESRLQSGAEPVPISEAGSFLVNAALRYMREHCTQRLNLSDVAENVYVSPFSYTHLTAFTPARRSSFPVRRTAAPRRRSSTCASATHPAARAFSASMAMWNSPSMRSAATTRIFR